MSKAPAPSAPRHIPQIPAQGVTSRLGGELVDRLSIGVDEGADLNAPHSLLGGAADLGATGSISTSGQGEPDALAVFAAMMAEVLAPRMQGRSAWPIAFPMSAPIEGE